jgi:hypothetical protein
MLKRTLLLVALAATLPALASAERSGPPTPRGAGGWLWGYATQVDTKARTLTLVACVGGPITAGRFVKSHPAEGGKSLVVQARLAPGARLTDPLGKAVAWSQFRPCQEVSIFTRKPWKSGPASAVVLWRWGASASVADTYRALLDAGSQAETRRFLKGLGAKADKPALLAAAAEHGSAADMATFLDWLGNSPAVTALKGDALLKAARAGKAPLVAALLASGAALGWKDKQGQTALHKAALSCNLATVSLLLARGADPTAKDSHNNTPRSGMCRTWDDARPVAEALDAAIAQWQAAHSTAPAPTP